MNQLCALPTWRAGARAWVDDQLDADDRRGLPGRHPARRVRRRAGLGRHGAAASGGRLAGAPGRPDAAPVRALPRHRPARDARPSSCTSAAALLGVHQLSPRASTPLAPVSCHALFCLGAMAYWEGRPRGGRAAARRTPGRMAATRRLTCGRWSTTRWSCTDAGDHEAALAFEERRSRWPSGSATSWPSPGSGTTGPARCATWAAYEEAYDEFAGDAAGDPRRRHPRRRADQLRGLRVRALRHGPRPGRRAARRRRAGRAGQHRRSAHGLPGGRGGAVGGRGPRSGWATSGSRCWRAAPSWACWPRWPRHCARPSSVHTAQPQVWSITAGGLAVPGTAILPSAMATSDSTGSSLTIAVAALVVALARPRPRPTRHRAPAQITGKQIKNGTIEAQGPQQGGPRVPARAAGARRPAGRRARRRAGPPARRATVGRPAGRRAAT